MSVNSDLPGTSTLLLRMSVRTPYVDDGILGVSLSWLDLNHPFCVSPQKCECVTV